MSASPFLESIRRNIRARGYSIRTEKTYIYWIRYYINFSNKQHPKDMGATEVSAFLCHLGATKDVAINTQKTALNALAFLYNHFLKQPLGQLDFTFASKQRHLPVVMSRFEVTSILQQLEGLHHLIFSLLYGNVTR